MMISHTGVNIYKTYDVFTYTNDKYESVYI